MSTRRTLAGLALCLSLAPTAAAQAWTWFAGDTHVHLSGCSNVGLSPADLAALMEVSGTHVAHALVWGGCTTVGTELQCSHEKDGPLLVGQHDQPLPDPDAGLLVHVDLELSQLPGEDQGHLVLLNLAQVEPVDASGVSYPGKDFLLPNFAWAQSQGALVGFAHGQQWQVGAYGQEPVGPPHPRELVLDATLARLDVLETNVVGDAGYPGYLWLLYRLWDAGLPVAPVAGSDYPCRDFGYGVGRVQTLVPLPAGQRLGMPSWIDAIRSGRTVIRSNTPGVQPDLIDLRVEGYGLGSRVIVPDGTTHVRVEVEGVSGIAGQPLELLVDGEVVATVPLGPVPTSVSFRPAIAGSSWIAARTPDAHTAAIFVLLDGRPVRNDPEGARSFGLYLDAWLAQQSAAGAFGASLGQVQAAVQQARELWTIIAEQGDAVAALPPNQRPLVEVGPDRVLRGPGEITLDGLVADDGLPHPALATSLWMRLAGPGVVSFGDPASPQTTARFVTPGNYRLQLRAWDGALEVTDELTVRVLH